MANVRVLVENVFDMSSKVFEYMDIFYCNAVVIKSRNAKSIKLIWVIVPKLGFFSSMSSRFFKFQSNITQN